MEKFYVSGYSFFEVLYEIIPITFFVGVALFILSRVLIYCQFSNSIKQKIDTKWKICIALLGIIGVIIFFIFSYKDGNKYTKKSTITKCLSVIILDLTFAVVCFGIYNREELNWESYSNEARCEKYIFKNSDGERVIYDKMGNEYCVDDLQYNYDGIDDDFYYYTENGDAYTFKYDIEIIEDEPRYVCSSTNDIIYSEDVYIDENGYLVKITNELDEIYDKELSAAYFKDENGNYYFSPYNCSWDSNGNLLFAYKELNQFIDN